MHLKVLFLLSFIIPLMASADVTIKKSAGEQSKTEPQIEILKTKFKKRNKVREMFITDFDRSECGGVRLNLILQFTNRDKTTHIIDRNSFLLTDAAGNEYSFCEYGNDIRRDILDGKEPCSPQIPIKVILSYLIPTANSEYYLQFLKFAD